MTIGHLVNEQRGGGHTLRGGNTINHGMHGIANRAKMPAVNPRPPTHHSPTHPPAPRPPTPTTHPPTHPPREDLLHSPHIVLLADMIVLPAQPPPVEPSVMVSEGQQVIVPEGGAQQLA